MPNTYRYPVYDQTSKRYPVYDQTSKIIKTKEQFLLAKEKYNFRICKVTLRNQMMYDFFEKLIKISLPRTRDFRGHSDKSFDGRGNYTLGVKEHIIFPEIDFDKIDKIKGLDICITTSAKNNEEAMELFKQFNFPFK